MYRLQIRCFNTCQVSLDDRPITTFQRAKAKALLIYLAVERNHPHPRLTLSGLLWPDYPEKSARQNFSKTLTALRRVTQNDAHSSAFFDIGTHMIALNTQSDHWIDVAHFENHLAQVRTHNHPQLATCDDCTQALQKAVDLYTGPFLKGYEIAESDLFEHWIEATREQLHQQALDAFSQLSQAYVAQNNLTKGLAVVRRLLNLAPWQEEAHRQLMVLLAQSGQRTQALAQYDQCATILMDEFGVSPSPETDTLYDQILSGEFGRGSSPPPHFTSVPSPTSPQSSVGDTHFVPFQAITTPPHFAGRIEEIQAICTELSAEQGRMGKTKMLALIGMGGVGKTTLAASIAYQVRSLFQDGVLWANAAISSPLDILDLWGRAYGYDFSGLSDLESRASAVRNMLVEKETLIVLDNVEDAALVRPLLPNGERCAVLLTTRNQELAVALNAKIHRVAELSINDGIQILNHILGEARVQKEPEEALAICTLLHCLPLAVEIAAQRLKSRTRMKLGAMAKRLSDIQQRLNLNISDQAVRTSFAVSWDALDAELRRLFALQGVFQGRPFSADAIAYLDDMDPFEAEDRLYDLLTLSLLREESEESYYRQHPLLADFAQEKLREIEDFDMGEIHMRLVDYYLTFSEENLENYVQLELEWGNIMAAIEIGHQLARWKQVVAFTNLLTETWLVRARFHEARQAYKWAQEAAKMLVDQQQEASNLLRWGKICIEQNSYEEAHQYLSKSLSFFHQLDNPLSVADAQIELARIAIERSQFEEAGKLLEHCSEIRDRLGDREGAAVVMYRQASISYEYGDFDRADRLLQEALQACENAKSKRWPITILRLLVLVEIKREAYVLAHTYCEKAYQLAYDLQDTDQLATLYYYWTGLYRKQSKFDRAREYGEQALPLLQKLGLRRLEGMVRYQLGAILIEFYELNQAKFHLLESILIFESIQDMLGKLLSLVLLGDIYQLLEFPEQSRSTWLDAQIIAQKLNHHNMLKRLKHNLATI